MVISLGLREFLETSSNARKVFGRREIEIVTKQLSGISLTQSEKNRLSRDIRQKLRFMRELSRFQGDFELKKGSASQRIIDRAVQLILQDKLNGSVEAVLLFGSHADGTATRRSDIDIAVVFTQISLEDATRFRIRVSKELPEVADIQVFNVLPQKVRRDIARSHKLLYKQQSFDNLSFTIRYLKDEDYFMRVNNIFGVAA